MIAMLVPTVPDRENPSQGPRRNAEGGAGTRQAFEGEIRGAESRASQMSAGKGAASASAEADAEAPTKAEAGDAPVTETPDAGTGVVGLLAALGGRGPEGRAGSDAAIEDAAATLARSEGLASKGLGKTALPGQLEEPVGVDLLSGGDATSPEGADLRLGTRARLKIAHQETHFEPTMREGVLVADETAAAGLDARAPDARPGLLQLLATPRTSAGAERRSLDGVAIAGPASDEASQGPGEGEVFEVGVLDNRRRPDGARMRAAQAAQFTLDDMATRSSVAARATSVEPGASMGSSSDTGLPMLSTQVAGRIVDAFSGVFSGGTSLTRSEAATSEAQLRLKAGGSVLKTLTIQLQPEHLGTLNISMSLKDGQLTLEMAANRAETARLLSQDRGALRSILEKAGFSIDDAAIAIVNRDAPAMTASQGPREAADGANRDMARSGDFQPGGERRERGDGRESRASLAPVASSGATPVGRAGAGAGTGARASGTVFL